MRQRGLPGRGRNRCARLAVLSDVLQQPVLDVLNEAAVGQPGHLPVVVVLLGENVLRVVLNAHGELARLGLTVGVHVALLEVPGLLLVAPLQQVEPKAVHMYSLTSTGPHRVVST